VTAGIERLAAYLPTWVLAADALARARGVAPEQVTEGLGVRELAVLPPCEDVVTLAANAGARLLAAGAVDPGEIGLLAVGTQSGVDEARPVASFVHELLAVGHACRTLDVRHGSYSGAGALALATDWVRAGGYRRRRALVIAADAMRFERGSAAEAVQGAGAVAMLVESEPRALQLGTEAGLWAAPADAVRRPAGAAATLVDGPAATASYLDAVGGAFQAYRPHEWPALGPDETLADRMAGLVFHAPVPALALGAHRRLIEADWRAAAHRWAAVEPRVEEAVAASAAELVLPGVAVVARTGNVGSASLFLCLASLLEQGGRRLGGRRLGLFAYGAGACGEFFTGAVPSAVGKVAGAGIAALLAARTAIDVADWERAAAAPAAGGEPPPAFAGTFVLRGVDGGRRRYARIG
jgi:hydroxymethylglutaryl-CoA synthase